MYVRKVTHYNKSTQTEYHTYKLVESVRTERGLRQRTLINLKTDFTLPKDEWKDFANRVEEIIAGQMSLLTYSQPKFMIFKKESFKIMNWG